MWTVLSQCIRLPHFVGPENLARRLRDGVCLHVHAADISWMRGSAPSPKAPTVIGVAIPAWNDANTGRHFWYD